MFGTAAGVASVATAATLGLGRGIANAVEPGIPNPIPGGSPGLAAAFGELFHVYAPGVPGLDDFNAEPATITDFEGTVGLAYISGNVRRTNRVTGESLDLPFVESDMRFMKCIFRGTDGRRHGGAFALI